MDRWSFQAGEAPGASLLPLDRGRIVRRQPSNLEPEAQSAHRGDDVGLLEDEPAHDLRPLERVLGQHGRAGGEVRDDRVRLGQVPVLRLQHGRRAGGVDPRELVGQRVAGEDVDRDALVLKSELGEDESRLVAVTRSRVVVETEGAHGDSLIGDAVLLPGGPLHDLLALIGSDVTWTP